MKYFIKSLFSLLIIVLCLSACSCSVFVYDNAKFIGGDALNNNLLEQIKQDVFSEMQSSEKDGVLTENENTHYLEDTTSNHHNDAGQENNNAPDTEHSTVTENSNDKNNRETVYWTSSGSVWHLDINCSYLKNSKEIISGSVQEAIEDKKDHACSKCQKNQQ